MPIVLLPNTGGSGLAMRGSLVLACVPSLNHAGFVTTSIALFPSFNPLIDWVCFGWHLHTNKQSKCNSTTIG
jgi:hypothetical protein